MQLLLIVAVCIVAVYGRIVPDYFPECKRSDPKIESCVLEGVEAMRSQLIAGIPEVNLPPLDPFKMDSLTVDSRTTSLTIRAQIGNLKAVGGKNYKIEKLRLSVNNKYAAEVTVLIPRLEVEADFNTRGSRMLFFNINNKGKFRGNFTGITALVTGTAKPLIKDGVEYLRLDAFITKISISKGEMEMDPLERSFTARAASSFIRSSPKLVLGMFAPVIDEAVAPIAKKIVNDMLAAIPLREILID